MEIKKGIADDFAKAGSLARARSVQTEILMFVLPIVVIGLVIMSAVIFKYVATSFDEQITRNQTETVSETTDVISEWLDARMLETRIEANNVTARSMSAEAMNLETRYRYEEMKEDYPGVRSTARATSTAGHPRARRRCTTRTRPGTRRP